jgi:hypothetical protein
LASAFRAVAAANPLVAMIRAAGLGWALMTWGGAIHGRVQLVGFAIAVIALVALERFALRRQHFAAVVASVMFVHLAALPPSEDLLRDGLWLQPLFSAGAFGLLVLAGMRHVNAEPSRIPLAKYRSDPLCVVPRIDRDRAVKIHEFPVKIDVA